MIDLHIATGVLIAGAHRSACQQNILMRSKSEKESQERRRESEGGWRISITSPSPLPPSNESQVKYQSLIVRNKQLAAEILKIRSKNENLKKELQEFRRKQFLVTNETKSTQTSDKVRNL
jgi:predicted RNase H-like nuclease (RuvC/YqgF family)